MYTYNHTLVRISIYHCHPFTTCHLTSYREKSQISALKKQILCWNAPFFHLIPVWIIVRTIFFPWCSFFPCFWDPASLVGFPIIPFEFPSYTSHHILPIYVEYVSRKTKDYSHPRISMISYDIPFFDLTQNHSCGWNPIVLVLKCQPIHRLTGFTWRVVALSVPRCNGRSWTTRYKWSRRRSRFHDGAPTPTGIMGVW